MEDPYNDEGRSPPRDAPSEKSNEQNIKVPEVASAVNSEAVTASAADLEALEFEEALGEPALARVSRIISRTDIAGGTVYRFPTYAPESLAFHELVAFSRHKRLSGALLRLHKRGALPFYVLLANLRGHVLELGVDLTDPAMIAAYQKRLDAIAWSLPRQPLAVAFAPSSVQLADEAGLGLRYQDDAPTGGAV